MNKNANGYDTWDVQSAAGKLISFASSIAFQHLSDGMVRLFFTREVAHYAKRIANDVLLGKLAPEEAINAIRVEQRYLLSESTALRLKSIMQVSSHHGPGHVPQPLHRLMSRPVLAPDPHRLQRYIGAQQRYIAEQSQPHAESVSRSGPTDLRPPHRPPVVVEYHDPGFYIVPKSTTAEKLQAELFTSPTPVVLAKFRNLNPGLEQVKAGQLIVLSDPANPMCTREEALLMAVASEVGEVLEDFTPEEADFMMRHREEIEWFLAQGSTSIGVGEAIFSKHLSAVRQLMQQLEELHTRTLAKDGHLRSPEFFAQRKRLLAQLDSHLTRFTKKSIGFPDHPKLKTALGISSRSLVHRYGRAGGRGQNSGHATHLKGVARAARYVKYGGWIGMALGATASAMKVQDVCTAGDAKACERVKYTETGGFVGGVVGGVLVGNSTAPAAGAICIAMGVPTAGSGTLICAALVVGGAALLAGAAAAKGGEVAGEIIFETTK